MSHSERYLRFALTLVAAVITPVWIDAWREAQWQLICLSIAWGVSVGSAAGAWLIPWVEKPRSERQT